MLGLRVAILAAVLASPGLALRVRSPEQVDPVDLSFREVADANVTNDANDTAACAFMTNKGPHVDCSMEWHEHQMVKKFLPPHSTVLELGSRYGLTSCHVANKQGNSGKLVAVEPDPTVALANSINARARKCTYHFEKGAVGNTQLEYHATPNRRDWRAQYGATTKPAGSPKDTEETVVTPVKMLTLEGLEKKHNLKFDAVIADCEGCFLQVVKENPGFLNQIHTLIIEMDGSNPDGSRPDYAGLEQQLNAAGLNQVGELDSRFLKDKFNKKQVPGKTYWPVKAFQRGHK